MSGIARLLAPHESRLPLRVLRRMVAIGGYDRALALAAQGFVAVVPAVLVLSSLLTGSTDTAAVAGGLGLSRSAVVSLTGAAGPSVQDTSLTVLGVVLLVVSVLGFIRSLQRTYAAAWELPPSGIRGVGRGLLAATALVAEFAVLVLAAPLLSLLTGSAVIGVVVHTLVSVLLWWPIQRVLLAGRVSWRALLPGALVTGVAQAALVLASGVYVPVAASRAADRLGLLGIAVVLVSWLVVLGLLLVVSAVLGAEIAQPTPARSAAEVPVRYLFSTSAPLSDLAAAAFPELGRPAVAGGATHLSGEVRDADHLHAIIARFGDLGLDLVDVHRLPG